MSKVTDPRHSVLSTLNKELEILAVRGGIRKKIRQGRRLSGERAIVNFPDQAGGTHDKSENNLSEQNSNDQW